MSKQINYYMDKNAEKDFIEYIYDNSFMFINWYDGTIINPYEDNSLFYFITREKYLPYLKFRNNAVDVLHCLVIEYARNNIIEDKKIVTRGRIYISDAYKDKQYSVYTKDFVNDYNTLKNWIKNHIPYQNYNNMDKIYKEYICDSMLKYSENNYRFQA